MAKYMNAIDDSFSGKTGDVLGGSSCGKHYVKHVPKISGKPKSTRQLAQQAKLGMAVRLLLPVKDLLFTFRKAHEAATGYNMALKYTLANAIAGDYPDAWIDYSQLMYTQGTWGKAECVEVVPDGGTLMVGWYANVFRAASYGDDQIHILVYAAETNMYFKGPGGVSRSEAMVVIPLPDAWRNKTLHTYVYCVSKEGKYSDSVYAGAVINS